MVRRLTVLNTPAGEDAEAAERSPRSWVLLGALLLVCLFLPSSLIGLWMGERLSRGAPNEGLAHAFTIVPLLISFAASAWSAGALTARFGLRTRPRHALAAGALGALFVLALSLLGTGRLQPWLLFGAGAVLLAVGASFAWLGARFGLRRRP